jgi:hypothetical protein
MKKCLRILPALLAILLAVLLTGCEILSVLEDASSLLEEDTAYTDTTDTSDDDTSAAPEDESVPETDAETEPDDSASDTDDSSALPEDNTTAPEDSEATLPEDGTYTTKEDVALYIHLYGHLPDNFITKKEAENLGWSGGSLEPYAPGKCIGGSRFGNYEGILPEKDGRTYTECDIDTLGADKRGAKRIVFSNDGLIYYTEDHYETFELLYGEGDS